MTSGEDGATRIYLMRHAHAGNPLPGQKDFDRTLDHRGEDEAAIVLRQAEAFGVMPDRIVSSAASRCRQTSAIMSGLHPGLVPAIDDSLYAGTAEDYLAVIRAHDPALSLLIVGHNPVMEELSELLVGPQAARMAMPYGFPTAGLLAADLATGTDAASGTAIARFLLSPSFSERF